MRIGDLEPRSIATAKGEIVLWAKPAALVARGPIVVALGGMFSPAEDLKNLPQMVAPLADACIIRMPGAACPLLSEPGVDAVAAAVGEVLETLFERRPVLLLGVSIGATAALLVRAANLARVLAVEPLLSIGELWPIVQPLRGQLSTMRPQDRAHSLALFGVGETGQARREYLRALADLCCPVDVVLGGTPLMPQRTVARFPSLVSAAVRGRLAATPNVRLHVADDAGHNVIGQAGHVVRGILLEGVRRIAAAEALEERVIDEPLLDATPLTARRVLYMGPQGRAFERAFLRRDPIAEVVLDGAESGSAHMDAFDAVVASGPQAPATLARIAAQIKDKGHFIARWAGEKAELDAALGPFHLSLRGPVDRAGTGVLRAQKCERDPAPSAPLHLHMVVFASFMMDIRTRLPARALASEPDLEVVCEAPPTTLAELPAGTPKFVIYQRRTHDLREKMSRLAHAIANGWMVLIEMDDHPLLVSEMRGLESSEDRMLQLGYAHAVQTATPQLVEAFLPYNPEVACFPNSAFTLAPFPTGERPRRVFYGAALRGDYGVAVARSLGPAIEQFPDTEFVVVGDGEVYDALPTRLKQFHGFMSFEGYMRLLETCSISLTPIAPLPMRETKSDAKFVDASRSGALTIASPTVYERSITHGHNGLIAHEVADWAPLLAQALGDQALRERIARRAWEEARNRRMFAAQIPQRLGWYRGLWARRDMLNEALLARIPGLRELIARTTSSRP